ncbi:nuclear transport factor 2B-like [Pistacia vera]|uniref:nuclear transport factor 2B-like n=1 Tax=Pistacia vera TaxID=55513 RepID=UPI0012637411|nr:nuclear transport factor 2B-like [Pistacia vera]
MEEQIDTLGKSFVDHYHHLFDSDRPSLSSLYQPTSMLTFEGQKIFGVDDISTKLNQLPFDQCRHLINTIDSQPCTSTGGIVIFVSGSLQLAGEEHHLRFSQMFHLTPTQEGNFFVQNDIFRLNYG